eukprot:7957117-Lingulodinium_polyedra.AAC.1
MCLSSPEGPKAKERAKGRASTERTKDEAVAQAEHLEPPVEKARAKQKGAKPEVPPPPKPASGVPPHKRRITTCYRCG